MGSCLQLYSLAEAPKLPHSPRIWAQIRGRYWSAKIDNVSLWPPVHDPRAFMQCCGSGSGTGSQSVGSLGFWTCWVQIRYSMERIRIRILLSSVKNSKKNPDSYSFVNSLWLFIYLWKMMWVHHRKAISRKISKNVFCWRFEGQWRL